MKIKFYMKKVVLMRLAQQGAHGHALAIRLGRQYGYW